MAAELEGQSVNYETQITIGPEHPTITYYVYAPPE
jgi:hypothetical protein